MANADFTLIHVADVQDAAAQYGFDHGEARFVRDDLRAEQVAFSHQRLFPGRRSPFAHSHADQEEIYYVISGSGRVKIADEICELKAGDAVRIAGPVPRQFEAGDDGLEVIAMSTYGVHNAQKIDNFWPE